MQILEQKFVGVETLSYVCIVNKLLQQIHETNRDNYVFK